MSRFEFSLATRDDDFDLRQLLAATPMQGDVSLSFCREPSYLAASIVDGEVVQVVIAREKSTQRIVGMGSRAISYCHVNGNITRVGYLSALRVLPEFRGQAGLLARGYQFFRELHQDGQAPFYLTTIAEDNALALRLLTSQRAGLPIYHPLGRYHTLTIAPHAFSAMAADDRVVVRPVISGDIPSLVKFLNDVGAQRQFFPEYGQLFATNNRYPGLRADSFLIATRGQKIVGTLGVWDQSSFKQTKVCGYSFRLRLMLPFYNALAAVRSRPKLPKVGSSINLRYGALFVVSDNDSDVALALTAAASRFLPTAGGDFLTVGLHEQDPLLSHLRPFSGREYVTLLFVVYWPHEPPKLTELTKRIPYLECGCL